MKFKAENRLQRNFFLDSIQSDFKSISSNRKMAENFYNQHNRDAIAKDRKARQNMLKNHH